MTEVFLSLNQEQFDIIIQALKKPKLNQKEKYLLNYLEAVKENWAAYQEPSLDECPF